jgi:hypothetical protein
MASPLRVSNEHCFIVRVPRAMEISSSSSLIPLSSSGRRWMAVVLLTAPIEGAPFHRARSGSRRSTQPSHHSFFYFFSTQCGRYPDKRVTGLPFTARVQRGPSEAARCASKKGNRLPATFFCAPLSIPSPPSPSAAPRPWLVQAPSRPPTDVGGMLQQTPSCAPHLF